MFVKVGSFMIEKQKVLTGSTGPNRTTLLYRRVKYRCNRFTSLAAFWWRGGIIYDKIREAAFVVEEIGTK